jgi:DNA-binding PadR family transcriptional regulator
MAYAIMQYIKELTKGRIILGAGTAYSSGQAGKCFGLIENIREEERRRIYLSTPLGTQILHEERCYPELRML